MRAKFLVALSLIAVGAGVAELGFPWTLVGLVVSFIGCYLVSEIITENKP